MRAMGPVAFLVRADVRRRWANVAVLVVLIGLTAGTAIAATAGARRTASAYERVLRSTDSSDALVNPDSDGVDLDAIAALPPVTRSSEVRGVFMAAVGADGEPDEEGGITLASDGHFGYDFDRPALLSGRMPRRDRSDEIYLSRTLADRYGKDVGDDLQVVWFDPSDEDFSPHEATLEIVGTGLYVSNEVLQPAYDAAETAILSPAWYEDHPAPSIFTALVVDLRPGAAERQAFIADAQEIAGADTQLFIQFQSETTDKAQQALRPYVGALVAFAIGIALTGLLVLGQALSRFLLAGREEVPALRATGIEPRQLSGGRVALAAIVGCLGAAASVVVAIAVSPIFPIGPAHDFDPAGGWSIDLPVVVVGAALVVLVVLVGGLVAARRYARAEVHRDRSSAVSRLTGSVRPTLATGLRMAFGRGGDRSVPARTTLAGAAMGLAAIATSLTFAANLGHLLETPRLYGWTWDVFVNIFSEDDPIDAATPDVIRAAPGVEAAVGGGYAQLRVDDVAVPMVGIEPSSDIELPIIEGRAVEADGEIVLGTTTLDRIDKDVGDVVEVSSSGSPSPMTIVGRAAFPRFAAYPGADKTGLGVGGLVTLADVERLVPTAGTDFALVDLAPEAGEQRFEAYLASRYAELDPSNRPLPITDPARPDDLVGYEDVNGTPLVLALALAAMAAATTVHGLVTATRARRRELAVLRALGMTGAQVRAAVRWQALLIVVVAALVGIPLGVATGRVAWSLLADRLGAQVELVAPTALLALTTAIAIVGAVIVSIIPARREAAMSPTAALRTE